MDVICSRKECSSWLMVDLFYGRLSPIEVVKGCRLPAVRRISIRTRPQRWRLVTHSVKSRDQDCTPKPLLIRFPVFSEHPRLRVVVLQNSPHEAHGEFEEEVVPQAQFLDLNGAAYA